MEEIKRLPDGTLVRYVDGQVVETWNPSALPNLAQLGTTTIGDDGVPVEPVLRLADPATPTPAASDQAPASSTGTSPSYSQSAPQTSYPRTSSTRPTSTRSSYSGGTGYDASYSGGAPAGFGGGFAEPPRYADNTLHPFFGGAPRVPGGIFAQQQMAEGGYDDRQQVSVPGGASAGPYGVRAAPMPDTPAYGGNAIQSQDGGGGGGGSTRSIIGAIRARVEGKLSGMMGGGSSGGYEDSTSTAQYRREGRRMDKAYDTYNEQFTDPEPLPVRGWAKQQGYKGGTIDLALSDPAKILDDVFADQGGYNSAGTPGNLFMESLPMTDLALANFGTTKKGLTQKTPRIEVPQILRGTVQPPKPETERVLNPSEVVNRMRDAYLGISEPTETGGEWFDTEGMLSNLANAHKKSTVRQQFQGLAEEDPGRAMDQAQSLVMNVLGTMPDNANTRSLMRLVPSAAINLGGDILRQKPKRADQFVNNLANAFLE